MRREQGQFLLAVLKFDLGRNGYLWAVLTATYYDILIALGLCVDYGPK